MPHISKTAKRRYNSGYYRLNRARILEQKRRRYRQEPEARAAGETGTVFCVGSS